MEDRKCIILVIKDTVFQEPSIIADSRLVLKLPSILKLANYLNIVKEKLKTPFLSCIILPTFYLIKGYVNRGCWLLLKFISIYLNGLSIITLLKGPSRQR